MRESFRYNEQLNNYFYVPDNRKLEEFIESFRFSRTFHYGLAQIGELTHKLMYSSALIKGDYRVEYEELGSEGAYDLNDRNFVPPKYIEEAIYLLTREEIEVEFVSIPYEYDLRSLYIYPTTDTLHCRIYFYDEPHYPNWIENPINIFDDSIIDFDDYEDSTFLLRYFPLLRMNIKKDSIENLILNRFMRLMKPRDYRDIILESIIIFETLLTSDSKELGFQLRVKLALTLAESKSEKKFIQEVVRILYNIRSDIVHSGGHKANKKAKKLGGLEKAAELVKRMVRLFLLRTLIVKDNCFELVKRDHLEVILDDFLIREQSEINSNIYFEKQLREFYSDIESDPDLSLILQ